MRCSRTHNSHISDLPAFSDELLFTGRKAFFAKTGAGGQSAGSDPNAEDEKKKPKNPLDAVRNTISDAVSVSGSKGRDDLVKKLEQLKSEGKITGMEFENAKRCARSPIASDRMLAQRLVEGSATSYRFRKLYDYLHNAGDAHGIATRRKAAELELTGKISPQTFDSLTQALESNVQTHIQAAEKFLEDPKSEKIFLTFLKEHPLAKKALPDILGSTALELEEGRILKNLTAFTTLELTDYLKQKFDTPREAEEIRKDIEEFREGSRVHSETFRSLTRAFDTQIGKGDRAMARNFEKMLSLALPENISAAEIPVTKADLDAAMEKTRLTSLIAPEFARLILEKLRSMQELEQKLSKLDTKIKKALRIREIACEDRRRIKNEADLYSKNTGISLKPGTKIRYQMPVHHDEATVEYRWVETEIEGIFIDKPNGETVEIEGKVFHADENIPLVVVTGAGRETLSRFKKWVMDTRAHQIIDTKEELDREIEFDVMRLPLKEGMELQQRIPADKDDRGKILYETHLPKIAKFHANGTIELDREVDVYRAGSGTVRGELLNEAIKKKVFTYGEFAQWIKRWNVLPHLTTLDAAQNAYNSWKQTKGDQVHTEPVEFKKGSFLTSGSYDNPIKLLINDVKKDEHTGHEKAYINSIPFNPTQLLRAATNGHYRTYDADNEARLASLLAPVGAAAAAAYASRKASVFDDQSRLAALFELEDMAHDLHDHAEEEHPKSESEEGNKPETDDERNARLDDEKRETIKVAEKEFEIANTQSPETSWLRTQWDETHFLTTQDVYQLGKAIWEYWNRRWERRMKHRYSRFGANMPLIGAEMFKIKEDAEHEEVGKYKHAYENMPWGEVRGILNNSSNQDEIRACIEVLVDKGQMRWDDVRTWEAINRIPALANDKKIPIPKNRDPYAIVGRDKGTGTKKNGMDYIADAVKSIWGGEDIFDGWESKNNSAYKSGMEKWTAKGEQLENDPKGNGGVTAELLLLLSQHIAGENVDAQAYEGLINYTIKAGKSTAEHKLYLIVMGVATNLLTIERVGALDSAFCNILPWLDFFTEKGSVKPVTLDKTQDDLPPMTRGIGRPFNRNDYKAMAKFFEEEDESKDKRQGHPGPNVKDFLWKRILPHKATLTRTQKGSRNADAMDHDDSHFILPLLDYESIRNMCGSSTGDKKYFSVPGYLNGFPGFSEWIRTLAELEHRENLEKALLSYVNYDGIISNRFLKEDTKKQRVTDTLLNSKDGCVVDGSVPVNFHRSQIQEVILNIGRAAGKGEKWNILFDKVRRLSDDRDGSRQKAIDQAIKDFGPELKETIGAIGEKRLFQIVREGHLKGYEGGASSEEKRRLLQMQAAQASS